jgi:hypothetical protein
LHTTVNSTLMDLSSPIHVALQVDLITSYSAYALEVHVILSSPFQSTVQLAYVSGSTFLDLSPSPDPVLSLAMAS